MIGKLVVLLVFMLTGCRVTGQSVILDNGRYELSIGEVPNIPASDFYPNPSGPGVMFYLKRSF